MTKFICAAATAQRNVNLGPPGNGNTFSIKLSWQLRGVLEAATENQGPRRSLRLALEPEAASTEREPQPTAGTDTTLVDVFSTNTRSNGEHTAKSPLPEAMGEELGVHAVPPVRTKALFTKEQTSQYINTLPRRNPSA